MQVAIPREILPGERRVAATPKTVRKLRERGLDVAVETRAGAGIFASDQDYEAAGARVVSDTEELLGSADMVLKVKQPTHNKLLRKHEVLLLKPRSALVTFLHPAAPSNHDMVKMLAIRGINSFSMDCIPRSPRAQAMDALTSMSTITGYRSVLLAAELLPRFVPMIGTAIGAVSPARFLVIGAGVVGLQALATAKRLGATTSVIDIRPAARDEAKSLGATVAGLEIPPELAMAEGGYARALPRDWLKKERELIGSLLPEVDAVILSALVPGQVAPQLVTADMLARMKPGSVLVDVSIDQGGNCDATKAGQTVRLNDVHVIGVQNIPGSMPVDASWLYSENVFNYLTNLLGNGNGGFNWNDEIVQASVVTRDGQIVHAGTRAAMRI